MNRGDIEEYSLDWKTQLLFPIHQMPGPSFPQINDGGYPAAYSYEGFIQIQHFVSLAIINKLCKATGVSEPPEVEIKMQRFPYPPFVEDYIQQYLAQTIGLLIMCSYIYFCINTVKVITNEKEKQIKEIMKIMGLPTLLHWSAWFVKSLMFALISVALIVVILKIRWIAGLALFQYADFTVLFVFLCLYICASITFCFMISSFCSKSNMATMMACLMWTVSFMPYFFMQAQYENLSVLKKVMLCLFSNTAMGFGFKVISMTEGTSEGTQWTNIAVGANAGDDFTLSYVMLMLIFDTFLYFLITLYVEAVKPGEFGLPQRWNFLCTRFFWTGRKKKVAAMHGSPTRELSRVFSRNLSRVFSGGAIQARGYVQETEGDMFEKEPDLYPGIKIKRLRKVFGKKVAVRGLTLNMYEGQITALLGHNGAGKTTTMLILTGIYPPSRGTAEIAGHDIISDMPRVRASLGLCPQHDVLFDDLTVKEHFYFFGKLKGLNKAGVNKETNKYVELLDLKPKANSRTKTLSGGMKRKLSIGIALCADSKIVMLDEPTAGMDPAARRAVWDILQAEKKGRTMLLTTHFMDEADLLGDRIAIMAGGTLQCCGSSFFLKKKYGAGYQLTLEITNKSNVAQITELLQKYIPNIQVDLSVGAELTYKLPEKYLEIFEQMLRDLEGNAESFGVSNYGISLTTLEEVFMKVGADSGQEEEQNALEINANEVQDKNETDGDLGLNRYLSAAKLDLGGNLLSGFSLYNNQFKAMLMKKTYYALRSWIIIVIQLLTPVTLLILTIVMMRQNLITTDLPPLEISLDDYRDSITLVEGDGLYKKEYIETAQAAGSQVINVADISQYILEKGDEDIAVIRNQIIVAASFKDGTITAWFNRIPFHSVPLTINLLHNAILHKALGKEFNIHIINHPLPFTVGTKIKQTQAITGMSFQIAFIVGFSLAFVAAFFILFSIKERVCKFKHLQFVSGVNVLIFWTSTFLFDFIHFVAVFVLLVLTLAAFQEEGFSTFIQLGRVFFILLLYAFAMLPLIYLLSFIFAIPASGFTIAVVVFVLTGCFSFFEIILWREKIFELEEVSKAMDWMCIPLPQYGVCLSMFHLKVIYDTYNFCNKLSSEGKTSEIEHECANKNRCCSMNLDYYSTLMSTDGILRNIFFFLLVGSTLFILVILIDYHIPAKIISCCRKETKRPPKALFEDEDVTNEQQRVKDIPKNELKNYNLVLRSLSKYYRNFLAVNKVSLQIDRFECFGLLGANGAGKTTTFKMLTGDYKISYGDAWVKGMSVKHDIKKVSRVIGYCPQFDALLENLTGRETMKIFYFLRGVRKAQINSMCEKLADEFGFRRHIDKKVKDYSGGNKRKLSTAVALIGDPSVVYLDEPSTGMDPMAKRMLWNGLCKFRDNGKCIVLTSHSMEEAEALCTRLAIMVNGIFRCIGSTQHLKSKFSEGYTITVKVRKDDASQEITDEDVKPIEGYIFHNFPHAVLREQYMELLTYYISETDIPWSRMFGVMEEGKQTLKIADYSIGQCTLEQNTYWRYRTSDLSVRAGSSINNVGGTVHQAYQVILHPNYNYNTNDYDFALIQVSTRFNFNLAGVKYIKLTDSEPSAGTMAVASGYGRLEYEGRLAQRLRSVEVPIATRAYCQTRVGGFTSRMICAGYPQGGRDACTGDSGGPLRVGERLVGVVSTGAKCGYPNSPGVYSNVANQRSWIRSLTGV